MPALKRKSKQGHKLNFTDCKQELTFEKDSKLEIKFEIEGPGLLESFDAPKIYSHNGLEEFDAKVNLDKKLKSIQVFSLENPCLYLPLIIMKNVSSSLKNYYLFHSFVIVNREQVEFIQYPLSICIKS